MTTVKVIYLNTSKCNIYTHFHKILRYIYSAVVCQITCVMYTVANKLHNSERGRSDELPPARVQFLLWKRNEQSIHILNYKTYHSLGSLIVSPSPARTIKINSR